jgi:hypothetical protein
MTTRNRTRQPDSSLFVIFESRQAGSHARRDHRERAVRDITRYTFSQAHQDELRALRHGLFTEFFDGVLVMLQVHMGGGPEKHLIRWFDPEGYADESTNAKRRQVELRIIHACSPTGTSQLQWHCEREKIDGYAARRTEERMNLCCWLRWNWWTHTTATPLRRFSDD